MVVDTCPGSSAALAIRMRRKSGGPWLEEGPRELEIIPNDEPNEFNASLVPRSMSVCGMRLAAATVALRVPDFFLTTTRDIRRCILDSRFLF